MNFLCAGRRVNFTFPNPRYWWSYQSWGTSVLPSHAPISITKGEVEVYSAKGEKLSTISWGQTFYICIDPDVCSGWILLGGLGFSHHTQLVDMELNLATWIISDCLNYTLTSSLYVLEHLAPIRPLMRCYYCSFCLKKELSQMKPAYYISGWFMIQTETTHSANLKVCSYSVEDSHSYGLCEIVVDLLTPLSYGHTCTLSLERRELKTEPFQCGSIGGKETVTLNSGIPHWTCLFVHLSQSLDQVQQATLQLVQSCCNHALAWPGFLIPLWP